MSFPPGINAEGILYAANNPDTPGLSLGKGDAITIDNTTTPATVTINGLPTRVEEAYTGTMSGPWSTPIPVTGTLVRAGNTTNFRCTTPQFATVDVPSISRIILTPPIPENFRPVQTAGVLFTLYNTNVPFVDAPYYAANMVITAAGGISFISYAGDFLVGSSLGVAPNESQGWPNAPM